jgi:hypothetical protein
MEYMACWRAAAVQFDVDAFLLRFPAVTTSVVWRAGELDRRGNVLSTSGFNHVTPDASTRDELLHSIRSLLMTNQAAFAALGALGVESEIDVGLVVGPAMRSIALSPADMAMLHALGVTWNVSAYPASDA